MYCNPLLDPPLPTLSNSTILQAKDQGSQFIVAVNDPAFPFAADAELVIPCERDRSGAGVGTLSPAAGGLDNRQTAAWLVSFVIVGAGLI